MKSVIALLVSAIAVFAYPGGKVKEEVKIPDVEKWKISDVEQPKYGFRFVRLSDKGTALKPEDPTVPVLETVLYEDPNHPGEFGGIYRLKNDKGDWVTFAKCWGLKKVDGKWVQDVDTGNTGVPDTNGSMNYAVLNEDGSWTPGQPGKTIFSWATIWHDKGAKDYPVGFSYCLAYEDDNEPNGIFMKTGNVWIIEPPKTESEDPEDGK